LREDLSIECGTDEHIQLQTIAYLFFAIWPVGMPILYFLVLLPSRKSLEAQPQVSTPLTRATSFLHQEYIGRYYWWESLFVLQRLMVTGFVMMFFTAEYAVRRIMFGISATLVYMAMLLIFRPYAISGLNFLSAIGSQFALAFSMLCCLCLRIFNDIAARHNIEDAQQIMKFQGPPDMMGVVIAFAFLALFMMIMMSFYDVAADVAVEASKSDSTASRFIKRMASPNKKRSSFSDAEAKRRSSSDREKDSATRQALELVVV